MKHKKTFYELLGLTPSATDSEIRVAHQRLLQYFESGTHGLDHAEADFQLKLINQAFWTLSDNLRRSSYDSGLAALTTPVQVEVEFKEPRQSPLRMPLIVIGSLMAAGLVIQIGVMLMAYRNVSKAAEAQSVTAERERTREYGGMSESEIADQRLTEKQRREEREEQEQARKIEREQQEQARKVERELENNRRYAASVASDLERAEERARREAEYEKRRIDEEQRRKQQEENYRIENQKRVWRQELGRRNYNN